MTTSFKDMLDQSQAWGTKAAISQFDVASNTWKTLSFADLKPRVEHTAMCLLKMGVSPETRVAFLGEGSIEWLVFFLAVLRVDATAIPLDFKLSRSELELLAAHCEPAILLTDRKNFELAQALKRAGKLFFRVICYEEELPQYNDLSETISTVEREDSIAVICYTSGTYSHPKGVLLSRRNVLSQLNQLADSEPYPAGSQVLLSILPFYHIYGLVSGPLISIRSGYEFCIPHALTFEAIRKCLKERKVTQFCVVPLFLKMLRDEILSKVKAQPKARQLLFRSLNRVGAGLPGFGIQRRLFREIHQQLGGNLQRFISGGAKLSEEVTWFFFGIGLPVYEGYGLTETAPVITRNNERDFRINSVGKPLPSVAVKISDEGEVLTKSDCVFMGYWKDQESHEASFAEGWFKTGDLGYLKDGYLFLSGRKKSLIVLEDGKKVNPEEIEALISSVGFVKNSVVCLKKINNLPTLVCYVELSEENRAKLASDKQLEASWNEALIREFSILSEYKRPKRVSFLDKTLPVTNSQKVKRAEVENSRAYD